MSLPFASEQFASVRRNTASSIARSGRRQDERAAIRSAARLLITASTQRGVEMLARHIHRASGRAALPFVLTAGRDLPTGAEALTERCCAILDAAAGGSLFISNVEEMPPVVQNVLLELLYTLESTRHSSATVRLIAGTTVSLFDRVTSGTFSDRLFYRLNIIHLMQGDRGSGTATPTVLQ